MRSLTTTGPWARWHLNQAPKRVALLFAALILVASPAIGDFRATDSSTKFDIHLQQRLARAGDDERLVVFVLAKDVATAKLAVQTSGMHLGDTFDKVGTAVAQGTPSQIRKASAMPGVDFIEFNRPAKLMLDTALKATRSHDAFTGFTEAGGSSSGVDGAGISIAVLDTGIDGTHPFFQQNGKSKVVKNLKLICPFFEECMGPDGDQREDVFIDFTNSTNDTDAGSAGGHGTHVAGIAAGVPVVVNGKAMQGAAPGAKLVGLSVGQGLNVYGGFVGLNWVLEHHAEPCGAGVSATECPPIKVVNNSYGGSGEWNPDGLSARLQSGLVTEGVNVVWAAGNGDEVNNGGNGSDNRVNPDSQHPAPGIISVANYDDQGTGTRDGGLDSSSSRGENGRPETYPDISAPGSNILSSCRTYLISCKLGSFTPGDYAEASGTSMASPLVAGIVAQLRQAGPWLSPGDIENVIQDSAYKFTFGGPYESDPQNAGATTTFDKGAGLIDAKSAVAKIRAFTLPSVVPKSTCSDSSGPVVTDPKEDLVNASPPEPSLDLREGRLRWNDSSKELTFEILVEDLGASNSLTAPEVAFNFNFKFGEEHLYVEATRDSTGEETFVIGSFLGSPGVNPRIHLEDLSGVFDDLRDVVQIVLPSSVLELIDVEPFKAGDRLTTMDIVARRGKDVFLTTGGLAADVTDGWCDFVVGAGATRIAPPPPVPLPPLPPPDGELNASSRKFEWQGSRSTNLEKEPFLGEEIFGCEGLDGPGCEEKYILLGANTIGGKVTVAIEGENPNMNDFDLYVYGPDRKLVAQSGEIDTDPGIEQLTFEVKRAGVYTVSVHAWLTVNAAYVGVAELEPPAQASGGQSPTSSGASPSPDPEKRSPKRSRPATPPSVEEAEESPPPSEHPAVGSGPSEAPSVSAPPLASPEIRTKGVSATASLAAGVAALLTGLAAGFAIAKRR